VTVSQSQRFSETTSSTLQPVDWHAEVFRLQSGGLAPKFVSRTATQSATVSSGSTTFIPGDSFADLPVGSSYIVLAQVNCYNLNNQRVGSQRYSLDRYSRTVFAETGYYDLADSNSCNFGSPPSLVLQQTEGCPGDKITFSLDRFPKLATVTVKWDGVKTGTITTDSTGTASGRTTIPSTEKGFHSLSFVSGAQLVSRAIIVSPRLTFSPTSVMRGSPVKIAARGFYANQNLTIYWLRSSTWVRVGTSITNSKGAADISIIAPTWMKSGFATIKVSSRYDTLKITTLKVSGGVLTASAPSPTATKTPTKTPTKTATATPTATTVPAETATAVSTETATATPVDTETPTETATPEPTVAPTDEPTQTPTDEATVPSVDPSSPVAGG